MACLVTLTPLLTSFSANNDNLLTLTDDSNFATTTRGIVDNLLRDTRNIINAVNLGRTCDPTLTPLNTLLGLVIQSYYIIIIMTYLTQSSSNPLAIANTLPFIRFVGNLGRQLNNILRCFCNPCSSSCHSSDCCLNSNLAPILTSLNTNINNFCNLSSPNNNDNATAAANAILPNLSDVITVLGPLRCDSCFLQVFNFIVKTANQLGLFIIIDYHNTSTSNQDAAPTINSLCSLLQQLLAMLRCPLPTSTGNPCGNICNTSCDPCDNLTSKASDLFSSFFGSF